MTLRELLRQEQTRVEETFLRFVKEIQAVESALSNGADVEVDATLAVAGDCLVVTTRDRETLRRLLSLSQTPWKKSVEEMWLKYSNTVGAIRVNVYATDEALPPTCELVTKKVLVPAVPEHWETQTVVECK